MIFLMVLVPTANEYSDDRHRNRLVEAAFSWTRSYRHGCLFILLICLFVGGYPEISNLCIV